MKRYELMLIIKPNLDMEEVDKVVINLEETIAKFEGKVINHDKLGRKKLAYDIENYRDGFFVVTNFEIAEARIIELKRSIKLNDSFLRSMLTVAPKVKATV